MKQKSNYEISWLIPVIGMIVIGFLTLSDTSFITVETKEDCINSGGVWVIDNTNIAPTARCMRPILNFSNYQNISIFRCENYGIDIIDNKMNGVLPYKNIRCEDNQIIVELLTKQLLDCGGVSLRVEYDNESFDSFSCTSANQINNTNLTPLYFNSTEVDFNGSCTSASDCSYNMSLAGCEYDGCNYHCCSEGNIYGCTSTLMGCVHEKDAFNTLSLSNRTSIESSVWEIANSSLVTAYSPTLNMSNLLYNGEEVTWVYQIEIQTSKYLMKVVPCIITESGERYCEE